MAGANTLLLPQWTQAITKSKSTESEPQSIPTRSLGKTGMEIPILSMGVMRADNPAVVRAAYNEGITHFDTAHGYQNGKNEEMLGTFFKGKDRNSFTIATKIKGNPDTPNFETDYEEALNISLRRLQMDYVDIFYAHAIDSVETINHPRLGAILKKFKEDGKIKHIGFSSHANKPEQIDEAIQSGVYEVILITYNFKLNILPELEAAIQRGVEAGIGFVAMKTMVGGVEDSEGKKKVDGAACLRWVWQNPNITTAIPGFTSYDLLDNCLEAAHAPELSESDKQYLAGLQKKEMLFCQNCGQCVQTCAKHLVAIPTAMRAYMYNFGYQQPSLSKAALNELSISETECSDCLHCTAHCPSGFKIKEKMMAILPVMNVPDLFLA